MKRTADFTTHAVIKFAIRTGLTIDQAVQRLPEVMEQATPLTEDEAKSRYSIVRQKKGDRYYEFYMDTIREPLLLIQRKDGAIVTMLTRRIYSYNPRIEHPKLNRQLRQKE